MYTLIWHLAQWRHPVMNRQEPSPAVTSRGHYRKRQKKQAPLIRGNMPIRIKYLTHWGWDKMADILQTTFSNSFSSNENLCIFIWISLKFVPTDPTNNQPILVQIMAWCQSVTNHYLNHWWPSLLTYTCITRPRWVNDKNQITFHQITYPSTSNGHTIYSNIINAYRMHS